MDIKKLLFVTKFDELRFNALQSLLDLRKAKLNHIVFLNVIEREKIAMQRGSGYQKKEEIRLKEKANIRFIDWAEKLFEEGMEVGVYIVVGNFVQKVIMAAEKEEVDLIVIGGKKKKGFEKFYQTPDSDIIDIISRALKPILIYRSKNNEDSENLFKRPILATDFSTGSLRSIEYLKGLHKIIENVDVIHVVDEKKLTGDSSMDIQKIRKETRKKLEKICDNLNSNKISARSHIYVGDRFIEVENAAKECKSTMIIAGTSGKNMWKGKLFGSTVQKLVEKSTLPNLLIPSK